MKLTRKAATRAAVLVAAGGVALGMSATAFAATPPYEPDSTNQIGQILFYDASGNLVTSGSTTALMPKFAVATADDPVAANNLATLYAYTPVNGQPPGNWTGEQLSGTTTFPVASPANVAAAGTHRPVVTDGASAGELTLSDYIADVPNTNAAGSGYEGLYQLRILTAGNSKYWAADVSVSGTTWTLQYATPAATTTTMTANPASPQTAPASAITLKAALPDGAKGSVVFTDTDTSTQVGSTQTLPGSTGGNNFATVTIPAGLAIGTHHYSAAYTPAVGALFSSSSGNLTYIVNAAPADVTTTSLSVTPTPVTVGDTTTLSSHVADTTVPASVPVGNVDWFDGATHIAGPVAVDGSGNASAGPSAFGLGSGNHSITAVFTPTNPANFNASTSSAVTFSMNPAAGSPCTNGGAYPADSRTNICSDDQTVQVTVPRGNLFISTPYTPANPLDLGTMQLSADGTTLHTAPKAFGTAGAAPAWSDGVTIIDTRAAGEGWTAAVTSTDFTSGTNHINACNLGFTGVTPHYISGNAINGLGSKVVSTTDVPNGGAPGVAVGASCSTGLAGGPHNIASIPGAPANPTGGTGSVYVSGIVDLYAPTSTPAGLYTATMTFTIF